MLILKITPSSIAATKNAVVNYNFGHRELSKRKQKLYIRLPWKMPNIPTLPPDINSCEITLIIDSKICSNKNI